MSGISSYDLQNDKISIYPNPFSTSSDVVINNTSGISDSELKLYNVLGEQVLSTPVLKQLTSVKTSELPSGIYFYKVVSDNKTVQSGKLISQQ